MQIESTHVCSALWQIKSWHNEINLTSSHFLHYVVYTCQKSLNFVDAFICYKQKCKMVSLNLAHPVGQFTSYLLAWQEFVLLCHFSANSTVVHCTIEKRDTGYGFAEPYFIHEKLRDLVMYYRETTLVEHNEILDVTLKCPVLAAESMAVHGSPTPARTVGTVMKQYNIHNASVFWKTERPVALTTALYIHTHTCVHIYNQYGSVNFKSVSGMQIALFAITPMFIRIDWPSYLGRSKSDKHSNAVTRQWRQWTSDG